MRIGTWNVGRRWTTAHRDFLQHQRCDVWLLTEVPEAIRAPGYQIEFSRGSSLPGTRWAAVLAAGPSRLDRLEGPHPASVAARVGGLAFVSTVLPWKGSGTYWPWPGHDTASKTRFALEEMRAKLPEEDLVWGGDWNHSLEGPELSGSLDGRRMILSVVHEMGLQTPTRTLPHRNPDVRSIDHVAVPLHWPSPRATHVPAFDEGTELSDHDAYLIDVMTEGVEGRLHPGG